MHTIFKAFENKQDAQAMQAYMKNLFPFFGIKAGPRRDLEKEHNKDFKLDRNHFLKFVKICFSYPEREMHHYALDSIHAHKKLFHQDTIAISEYIITHNSWWDTVDTSYSFIHHFLFSKDKALLQQKTDEWMKDENMWLRRSAIISQLKFKSKTDTAILKKVIEANLGSKEFFINKAIGWALREYAKTNPQWVKDFVHETDLSKLSRREALKHLG